ncbi:MAG: S9 family peptidase [Gemmataceae bacterium]
MREFLVLQKRIGATFLFVFLLFGPAGSSLQADPTNLAKESYIKPPKVIVDALAAPWHKNVNLTNISPDGKKFLVPKTGGMPSLAMMAKPYVNLGESMLDHVACCSRSLWLSSGEGYDIFDHTTGETVSLQVPDGARVSQPAWSPDGGKVAFLALFKDAVHLYLADARTGSTRRLTTSPVLATWSTSFQWSADGKHIRTVLLPDEGKRPAPKQNGIAAEPKVRVSRKGKTPSRTYRFLLESPFDRELLEHLSTGQLALIDVGSGKIEKVGFPCMVRSVNSSPTNNTFRVTTLKKPFSYYTPTSRFGSKEEIWDREGKALQKLSDRPIRETTSSKKTTTPTKKSDKTDKSKETKTKRSLAWRPDGNGMSFLEQEEPQKKSKKDAKGKEEKKTPHDQVMQWLPPFGMKDVKVVYSSPHKISSVQYSADCQTLFLSTTIDRRAHIIAVNLKEPNKTYTVYKSGGSSKKTSEKTKKEFRSTGQDEMLEIEQVRRFSRSSGTRLMTKSVGGVSVVRMSKTGEVFLQGTTKEAPKKTPTPTKKSKDDGKTAKDKKGDSKELGGAKKNPASKKTELTRPQSRPFIDRIDFKTVKKTRVFEGTGEMLETIVAVDGDDVELVFTKRENVDTVPDYYAYDVKTKKAKKLTNNKNYIPWYHQLKVQRFQVRRVDGFKFWVKVTTSPKSKGKLPALFWIYPREYSDQASYDRSTRLRSRFQSKRFRTPRSLTATLLAQLGYAVVEPDIPIVGPSTAVNKNYIPDLRNGLWAVIDTLDKKGIIDRDRLAVGGHSYGAFSTANALAHTPFFKAGIAGDGNYNRTLTPMSFQRERRFLWDARETYLEMSPLMWANRVNGALLMYHGIEDANTGTFPINSERMFAALDGLGKPTALYMYPYEGHGPRAKETVLDIWGRWVAWLDKHVKNPPKTDD